MLLVELAAAVTAAVVLTGPAGHAPPMRLPPPAPLASPASLTVGDHRTVELVNLGGPSEDALLGRIAANLGAAVDAVETFWGTDWAHHIVVMATGSDRQFAAHLTEADSGPAVPAGQWSDIAAVTLADRIDPGRRRAVGQRIVFAPGAAAMTDAALRIVLCHELFHYASRADTAVDAPRWLTEGVADFVARPAPVPSGHPAPSPALPSDSELDLPGSNRAQAYDRAWWFARFIADSYGTAGLRKLYLAACGAGHTAPDASEAVRRVFGGDLPGVLDRWRQWLATSV